MDKVGVRTLVKVLSFTILVSPLSPIPLTGQSVEEFVGKSFVHGVPYEEAEQFGPSSVDRLAQMLEDSEWKDSWTNIVYTIGYAAAGNVGVEILTSFVEREDGVIDREAEKAKRHSLIALGYLVARTGNEAGLRYLIESLNPETWTQRNIDWRSSSVGWGQLQERVIAAAIQGLGVTGTERAELAMQASPWRGSVSSGAAAELQEVVETAVEVNRKIRSVGVRSYLRDRRQR